MIYKKNRLNMHYPSMRKLKQSKALRKRKITIRYSVANLCENILPLLLSTSKIKEKIFCEWYLITVFVSSLTYKLFSMVRICIFILN